MLDSIYDDVSDQIENQRSLGVQISRVNDLPEQGPTNKGMWYEIPNVSTVFVDVKNSTALNSSDGHLKDAARTYTYFVRAMTVLLERFGAKYVDIQGDGVFGLFSGSESLFDATACAITMKTYIARNLASKLEKENRVDWKLTAGIGIDKGRLLVRRLGLRGVKQNEVWAGTPVNIAAKLSSVARPDQAVVSEQVYNDFGRASKLRRRAIIWSCGCYGDVRGSGLDAEEGSTSCLWTKDMAPENLGLGFGYIHRLDSQWCTVHGSEFCQAIVTGERYYG